MWLWLLAALLFVGIAGGAYYYSTLREQPIAVNDPTPPTSDPEASTAEEANAGTADETLADSTADATTATDTLAAPPIEEPPPEPPAETGPIDRAQGGYTLVVGSRGSQATAEADAERVRQSLNDAAIPVDVLQGTANGSTRYRIGVGQEPSIDEATALKQRLGNRITADAWVTRILPDS